MKKILLSTILLGLCSSTLCQSAILSFSGKDANNNWTRLNRVVITNQTQNWSETIAWPDTILTIQNGSGIDGAETFHGSVETFHETSLQLFQNSPNPFNGTTNVLLTVADVGTVTLVITDVNGRVVAAETFRESAVETFHETSLQHGTHQFNITLSTAGIYVMTAYQNGKTSSIKMMNGGGGNGNQIEYMGIAGAFHGSVETFHETSLHETMYIQKTSLQRRSQSGIRSTITRPFNFGDMMEYVGYAPINGSEDTVIVSQPLSDLQEIVMSFEDVQTDGFPCPGTPALTDIDGNVYTTVLIGSQCWMKDNLRTTRFPDNTAIALGTYTSSEPNYYNDSESYIPLVKRGYLYNWFAAMHEATPSSSVPSGVQGICPNGWHLPSEAEWEALKDYVSSRPEYTCGGNPNNIAKAVASELWWYSSNGECNPGDQEHHRNNTTGFEAVPAGTLGVYGYYDVGYCAHFWSATENNNYSAAAIFYGVDNETNDLYWATTVKERRASVRCLKD